MQLDLKKKIFTYHFWDGGRFIKMDSQIVIARNICEACMAFMKYDKRIKMVPRLFESFFFSIRRRRSRRWKQLCGKKITNRTTCRSSSCALSSWKIDCSGPSACTVFGFAVQISQVHLFMFFTNQHLLLIFPSIFSSSIIFSVLYYASWYYQNILTVWF